MIRGLTSLLALLAALTALATPASASRFSNTSGSAELSGADGQANTVTLSYNGVAYVVSDSAGIVLIDPDDGSPAPANGLCVQTSGTRIDCVRDGGVNQPDLHAFEFALGNGPQTDSFRYSGPPIPASSPLSEALQVFGGDGGQNTIVGSPGRDGLLGGAGPDTIQGHGGNDRISGFGGLNVLQGGLGDDFISAGPGSDRIVGEAGADRLEGGSGGDTVDGGAGPDRIIEGTPPGCGSKRDRYVGGPGQDFVQSFCGIDDFLVKDGERDTVICSRRGVALLEADGVDSLRNPIGGRCTRAGAGFTVSRQKLGRALRRGYIVRFTCPAACRASASLRLTRKASRSLGLPRRVARGSTTLRKGKPGTIVLRFTRRARKALAGARKVRLSLSVKLGPDGAPRQRSITLRR